MFIDFRGSVPFPTQKALNISKQSLYNQSQSNTNDVDFQSWMSRQTELKKNVRKVCDEYGKSLSTNVLLRQFVHRQKTWHFHLYTFFFVWKTKIVICSVVRKKWSQKISQIVFNLSNLQAEQSAKFSTYGFMYDPKHKLLFCRNAKVG